VIVGSLINIGSHEDVLEGRREQAAVGTDFLRLHHGMAPQLVRESRSKVSQCSSHAGHAVSLFALELGYVHVGHIHICSLIVTHGHFVLSSRISVRRQRDTRMTQQVWWSRQRWKLD
jgi:hypothetical protein